MTLRCTLALVAFVITGCGVSSDCPPNIEIDKVPPQQIAADRQRFSRHYDGSWRVKVSLTDLYQHPDTARAFASLGYVRLISIFGKSAYDFTKKGLTNSRLSENSDDPFVTTRNFLIAQNGPPSLFRSLSNHCESTEAGKSDARTYGYNVHIARLTPLGKELIRHGLLYLTTVEFGEYPTETQRHLARMDDVLHETFRLEPSPPASDIPDDAKDGDIDFDFNEYSGGEILGLQWSRKL